MKDIILNSLPAAAIALFGGLVSLFTRPSPFSVKFFIGGMISAVFVGFLVDIAMIELGYTGNVRTISVALSGYCARDILELIRNKFIDIAKNKIK